ncbi:MAG: hypothetical protein Q9199_004868 [Rusavskia elegans]
MSGALPISAVRAFDIVHVRALVLAVKRGDLDILVARLGTMLSTPPYTFLVSFHPPSSCLCYCKTRTGVDGLPTRDLADTYAEPGGYLQWDEVDIEAYWARSSRPAVSKTASDQFTQYFLKYMRSLNLSLDWVSHLPDHLTRHGFELVDRKKFNDADAVTCKLETDDHLMVLEDQLPSIATFLAREHGRASADIKQELERLFRSVVRETERGVSLHMDWYCYVARKV